MVKPNPVAAIAYGIGDFYGAYLKPLRSHASYGAYSLRAYAYGYGGKRRRSVVGYDNKKPCLKRTFF